jgi:hypothetical protein
MLCHHGKPIAGRDEGLAEDYTQWGTFAALGNMMYSKPKYGMGIAFTEMEPSSQAILEKWLPSLRTE